MTQSEPSRLDRIERISEQITLWVEAIDRQIASNVQQMASNARTIKANNSALARARRFLEESRQRTDNHTSDSAQVFFSKVEQADAARAEMRRVIEEIYGNRSNGNGSSEE